MFVQEVIVCDGERIGSCFEKIFSNKFVLLCEGESSMATFALERILE